MLPGSSCCCLRRHAVICARWRVHGGVRECVSDLLVFQVALMSAVPSAMAALDGHRGVAVVAEYGLGFLMNQSVAPENSVR